METMSSLLNIIDTAIEFIDGYNLIYDIEQKENENEELVFHLLLSSFGYKFGALKTTDLNINVRSVENPSVKLRKNQTGLQKRFRKDFFQIESVTKYYQTVQQKITIEIVKYIKQSD